MVGVVMLLTWDAVSDGEAGMEILPAGAGSGVLLTTVAVVAFTWRGADELVELPRPACLLVRDRASRASRATRLASTRSSRSSWVIRMYSR